VDNPFSWDYLTASVSETPTFGPFSTFYLILFGLSFIAAAFMYYDAPQRFSDNRVKRDFVRRATQWVMWVTAIGLIFFLIRSLRIEFLSLEKRIWMYLAFAAYLAVIGYIVYYARIVLPPQLEAYERQRERRRFMSPQAPRRSSSRRRRAAR
jgi:hypothetical protein